MNGIAMTIARRIEAIKALATAHGEKYPAAEIARQFQMLCDRSTLHSGPLSTRHMALLATELVPEATARLHEPMQAAA
jgi:hypothetical protein